MIHVEFHCVTQTGDAEKGAADRAWGWEGWDVGCVPIRRLVFPDKSGPICVAKCNSVGKI